MTAEEIVRETNSYESIHDEMADDKRDIRYYIDINLRESLRTLPVDDRADI